MKKANYLIRMICCGLLFCCIISCNEKDEGVSQIQPEEQNFATRMDIPKGYGDYGNDDYYQLTFKVGHHIDSCKNSCILIWGIVGHIDCMGYGDACSLTLFGSLCPPTDGIVSKTFSFEVDKTTHSELENIKTTGFEMPARSLKLTQTHKGYNYMNIPAQWVERVDSTKRFLIQDITLSNTPLY
jgi:hypothetical protein